jgi:multidrug resistance efflux pump
MPRRRILTTLSAFLTLAAYGGQISGAPEDGQSLTVTDCVVRLIDEAQVPAREAGVIRSITVVEGDKVEVGELLAQLDDQDAQAKLQIAEFEYRASEAQATNDVKVKLARAEAEVMESEFLRGQGTATDLDDEEQKQLRRLLLAPRRARLQISAAELEQEIAKLTSQVKAAQVRAAQAQSERHRVVSPLTGVVAQVYQHAGEWAKPGEPILHVVRMDRLRVVGYVNSDDTAPEEIVGRPVVITIHDRRGLKQEVESKVGFASPVVVTSGQFRIWAEVENRQDKDVWLLRPGLTADMTIQLK